MTDIAYDRQGRPISLDEWARSRKDTMRVDETKVGERHNVSTVHLGLDHSHGGPVPIIFETMVFSDNRRLDNYCERYATEAEAVAGHDRIVQMVRDIDAELAPKLTEEAVAERVARIAAVSDDDERAHGLEDDLYRDVLRQIADGTLAEDEAREIANAALKADGLDFSRWTA